MSTRSRNTTAILRQSSGCELPRKRTKSPVAGLKPVKRKLADGSTRLYWYHRATGKALKNDPNSAKGLLEIARLDAKARDNAETGYTFADLIADFKASATWRALADNTRRMYQTDFDKLAAAGEIVIDTLSEMEARKIIMDALDDRGFRAAQLLRTHLIRAIDWARDRQKVARNLFKDIPVPKPEGKRRVVNRRLDTDELHALFASARAEPGFHALLALQLFGGMRVGDARKVTRAAHRNGRIKWTAEKNGVAMDIEASGVFAEILDAAPRTAETIATNTHGKPWTKSGADKAFDRHRRALEEAGALRPGATYHGLRHSLASLARELGASDGEAAAAINDESAAMGARYGRGAKLSEAGNRLRSAVAQQLKSLGMENGMENAPVSSLADARRRKAGGGESA